VALMAKDIRLARDAAAELAIPVPSADVVDQMLVRASELGYAHRDLAALHEVLAKSALA
jgi:3-hydroxyisobutyrate dehydrogenase-like beta-hydroxyacid dehydrogenase